MPQAMVAALLAVVHDAGWKSESTFVPRSHSGVRFVDVD